MEDFRIAGAGTVPGGEYRTVSIAGMGKCTGDLRAQNISVSGTFKGDGAVECQGLKISGSFKCAGSLAAEKMSCSGAAGVQGDMVANALTVSGTLTVEGGKLEGADLSCSGTITAAGQVCADKLKVTGIIKAREIVGDDITIGAIQPNILRQIFNLTIINSTADLIEATTLNLSGVTAQTVNGSNITIGPGCIIDNLDCNGTLHIDPTSTVRNVTGEYSGR